MEEDDFGDFGDFGVAPETKPNEDDDEFGFFADDAALNLEATNSSTIGQSGDDDNFDETPIALLVASFGAEDDPKAEQEEEDDFGDFGDCGVAPEVTPNEDDDEFGFFGEASSPPETVSSTISPPGQDSNVDEAPVGLLASLSAVADPNADEVEDFGDFGDNGVAPKAIPHEDDEFGFFGEASSPPEVVSSTFNPPSEDSNVDEAPVGLSAESAMSDPNTEEEDFRDFGVAPEATPNDDDEFGNFGDAALPTEAASSTISPPGEDSIVAEPAVGLSAESAVADPNAEEEDFGDFGVAPEVNQNHDDEFGNFGEASSPPEAVSATTSPPGKDGNFDEAPTVLLPSESAVSDPHAEEGDFGDFGDFGVAPVAKQNEDDEFGNFGEASSPPDVASTTTGPPGKDGNFDEAPTVFLPSESAVSDPNAEEDDFGDFGGFGVAPEAKQNEDDEFGNFGEAAYPSETARSTISQPGEDSNDDFGDFGGFGGMDVAESRSHGPAPDAPFVSVDQSNLQALKVLTTRLQSKYPFETIDESDKQAVLFGVSLGSILVRIMRSIYCLFRVRRSSLHEISVDSPSW
jgi:hypothetical protein